MKGQSVLADEGTGGGRRRSQEQRLGVLEGEELATTYTRAHTHTLTHT